jgi:hypothetical protein
VGILTGPCSGIFAMDVDPERGGDKSLALLEREHGALPTTPRQRTGGGGEHILFRYPPGREVCSSVDKIASGLDVRGKGAYIVAAPSLHLSGERYDWGLSGDPETVPLADAPPWLLALLDGHGAPGADYEARERAAIEAESQGAGEPIPKGARNSALTREAGRLRRLGYGEPIIRAALLAFNRERCRPPLDDREVKSIAKWAGEKPPGGEARAKPESRPVLTRLSTVAPKGVVFLWPDRLPMGKLSVIAGDPGLFKSGLSLYVAARVTTGLPWPDGADPAPVGNVIILSAEDDVADTIRPRLDAAGADVSRVVILDAVREVDPEREEATERGFNLATDIPVLEDAIRRTGDVRLVIVDPVSAYLGGVDSHRNSDVRALLAPLKTLAERHGVAALCVSHLNKTPGAPAAYRVTGSLAFTAAARAVWAVVRDKDNPARRLLLPIKVNLAPDPTGLAFAVHSDPKTGQPVVVWERGPVLVSAEDALTPDAPEDRPPPAVRDAADWLRELLATAPLPVGEVEKAAKAARLSFGTVRKAMPFAGAEARKPDFTSGWLWQLQPGGRR